MSKNKMPAGRRPARGKGVHQLNRISQNLHTRGIANGGNGQKVDSAAAMPVDERLAGIPGSGDPQQEAAGVEQAGSSSAGHVSDAKPDNLESLAAPEYSTVGDVPSSAENSLAIDLADATEAAGEKSALIIPAPLEEAGSEHAYFRLHFYLMDDQLRCRFYCSPGEENDALLSYGFEMDKEKMREYIRNHLPENLRKKLEQQFPQPAAVASLATRRPSATAAAPRVPEAVHLQRLGVMSSLFMRIVISQARHQNIVKEADQLASREPARLDRYLAWSLAMTLALDKAPAAHELSRLRKSYSLSAQLIQLENQRKIFSTTIEADLAAGKTQYDSVLPGRGLEPGRYELQIAACIPLLLKKERKKVQLVVQ